MAFANHVLQLLVPHILLSRMLLCARGPVAQVFRAQQQLDALTATLHEADAHLGEVIGAAKRALEHGRAIGDDQLVAMSLERIRDAHDYLDWLSSEQS